MSNLLRNDYIRVYYRIFFKGTYGSPMTPPFIDFSIKVYVNDSVIMCYFAQKIEQDFFIITNSTNTAKCYISLPKAITIMPRVAKNVNKLPQSSPVDENRVRTTPILKEKEVSSPAKEEVVKEKKVRQHHSLPAKYSKFIEFGYYLLNKIAFDFIQDSNNESVVFNENEMLNKLRLLDPIDVQQQLVQEFFDTSKQIHKDLRDIVKKQQREAKKLLVAAEKKTRQPRARAPKVPAETLPTEPTEEVSEVKVKKTRAKKQKKESTEDALVNELVQLATGSGEPTVPPETPSLTDNSLTDKKADAIVATNTFIASIPPLQVQEKPVKEKKEKPVKEKKDKPVKEKKDKIVKERAPGTEVSLAVPTDHTEGVSGSPDDDDELQVSVFQFNGTQYLIDDHNLVYDFNSHLKIGSLVNNSISFEGTNGSL
jgi:hypothetical protein